MVKRKDKNVRSIGEFVRVGSIIIIKSICTPWHFIIAFTYELTFSSTFVRIWKFDITKMKFVYDIKTLILFVAIVEISNLKNL